MTKSVKVVLKAGVWTLAIFGLWHLLQAVWAYHNFPPREDIAYLRNDSIPVKLTELLCSDKDRQGTQLLDMAILAAVAYPTVDPSLRPRLSAGWKKQVLFQNEDSKLFPADEEPGLAFGLWYNSSTNIAVISFRGTDDALDWYSNFHWILRKFGIDTQYQKVRQAAPILVSLLTQQNQNLKTIFAVGQSLGGGLAQHALYSDAGITQAFVFNSSPVTGWTDIRDGTRENSVQGNIVTRVHEDGEVLEFLRLLMKVGYTLNPKPNENPFFEEYRFNFKKQAAPISTHKMSWLAAQMIQAADPKCAS